MDEVGKKKKNLPREHFPPLCGIQGQSCSPELVLTSMMHPRVLWKPFLGGIHCSLPLRLLGQHFLFVSLFSQLLPFFFFHFVLVEMLKTCCIS